jgi:hypothetical protein
VTIMADHLSDDVLSALLDAQLPTDEERVARGHLDACPTCTRRLSELQSVVSLLRSLPELEPARDFALGPRLVATPTNVVRLERWYAWTRGAAASLAAVFVLLLGGTLYLGMAQPTSTPAALEVRSSGAAANQAPASSPAPAAARAPAAPPAPAAAPQFAKSSARDQEGAATPDASDMVKAATSVSALATPTSVPVAQPRRAEPSASDAPLRGAASLAGGLTVLAVFGALVVRRRLRAARSDLTPIQE